MANTPPPSRAAFTRNRPDQERLALVVLEGPGANASVHVRAQYNPHEVQVDRVVEWNEHTALDGTTSLQYTRPKPRTMTLELFFDCYELPGVDLTADLAALAFMTEPSDPASRKDIERRPPLVGVVNGRIPNFRALIESLAVKVTMFDRAMKPVRATVAIKLKEVVASPAQELVNPASVRRANCLRWAPARGSPPEERDAAFAAMLDELE